MGFRYLCYPIIDELFTRLMTTRRAICAVDRIETNGSRVFGIAQKKCNVIRIVQAQLSRSAMEWTRDVGLPYVKGNAQGEPLVFPLAKATLLWVAFCRLGILLSVDLDAVVLERTESALQVDVVGTLFGGPVAEEDGCQGFAR